MPAENLTGFFGKLPATGDFVTRGLPAEARRAIDRWLTGRFGAGDEPPEGGLVALLPLGSCAGTLLVIGSADRFGRRFPLAAASVGPAAPAPDAADDWASAALPLLHGAVAGTLSPEELAQALYALPSPTPDAQDPPPSPCEWSLGSISQRLPSRR